MPTCLYQRDGCAAFGPYRFGFCVLFFVLESNSFRHPVLLNVVLDVGANTRQHSADVCSVFHQCFKAPFQSCTCLYDERHREILRK